MERERKASYQGDETADRIRGRRSSCDDEQQDQDSLFWPPRIIILLRPLSCCRAIFAMKLTSITDRASSLVQLESTVMNSGVVEVQVRVGSPRFRQHVSKGSLFAQRIRMHACAVNSPQFLVRLIHT